MKEKVKLLFVMLFAVAVLAACSFSNPEENTFRKMGELALKMK